MALAAALGSSACSDPRSPAAQKDFDLEIRPRPESPAPPEPDPETGFVSEEFHVPLRVLFDLLRYWNPETKREPESDPFSDPFSDLLPDRSDAGAVQQVLTALGIPFPAGTSAEYESRSHKLRVVQTPESMGLIRGLVEESLSHNRDRGSTAFRFEFYEVPALLALRIEQSASAHADNTPEWETLQSLLGENGIRLLNVALVQARSGERATYENGETYLYPVGYEAEPAEGKDDGESASTLLFEERLVGTTIEIDPVVGADDHTIDLNFGLEFDTAPPSWVATEAGPRKTDHGDLPRHATRIHAKKLTTQLTLHDGAVRLLASWTPTGKPEFESGDTRYLVFFAANIQRD